jgi:UDP-N-acetylmuramoyl-tripeptide--D-alanyl-D-alanine ligase
LWGVRGLAQQLVEGASAAGLTATRYFESSEDAAKALEAEVKQGDLILVKGSRGVATDKIVKTIKQRFPLAGEDEELPRAHEAE